MEKMEKLVKNFRRNLHLDFYENLQVCRTTGKKNDTVLREERRIKYTIGTKTSKREKRRNDI